MSAYIISGTCNVAKKNHIKIHNNYNRSFNHKEISISLLISDTLLSEIDQTIYS